MAMYTSHQSVETALSDHETSSDTTLCDDGEQDDETARWSTSPTRPVFDELPHSVASASAIFPLHLLAACSAAERAMCQFSQSGTTIASHEVKRVLGLKGM
ncbi:hypothetical protein NX059_011450 [Plenodomus lindquistii]|nr:hypothetical protein NX059_011450 [Plenodomus lindquistii]